MADYFLREDFARAASIDVHGAHALLRWAHEVAARATALDAYRQREGRTPLRSAPVEKAGLWRRVSDRVRRLYISEHGATPPDHSRRWTAHR